MTALRSRITSLCLTLVASGLIAGDGWAGGVGGSPDKLGAAVTSILIVNSSRANGMGGCAVNLVNEQAAFNNPGALGLFHLGKVVSFSVPKSTNWLPAVMDDLTVKTWGISLGGSRRLLAGKQTGRLNFSAGLAYSYMRFSFGRFQLTDPLGTPIGYNEPYDKSWSYTAGVGVEYYARLGVGYTAKRIESLLAAQGAGAEAGAVKADGDAYDWGVLIELPIHSLLRGNITIRETAGSKWTLGITPSFAYVKTNIGDDIVYTDVAQADLLPTTSKTGLSLLLELNSGHRQLASVRVSSEIEKLLLGSQPEVSKKGVEIGALSAVYVRLGKFEDDHVSESLSTWGFGLRLRGIIDWLNLRDRVKRDSGLLHTLAERVDLSYDFAKWSGDDSARDKTQYGQLSFSF